MLYVDGTPVENIYVFDKYLIERLFDRGVL